MRLQCLLARGHSLNRGKITRTRSAKRDLRIPASLCPQDGSGVLIFSGYFISLFSENGGHYPERIFYSQRLPNDWHTSGVGVETQESDTSPTSWPGTFLKDLSCRKVSILTEYPHYRLVQSILCICIQMSSVQVLQSTSKAEIKTKAEAAAAWWAVENSALI